MWNGMSVMWNGMSVMQNGTSVMQNWNACHVEWNECHAEWKHYTWIYGSLAKEHLCSLKRGGGVGAVFHNIHTHGCYQQTLIQESSH